MDASAGNDVSDSTLEEALVKALAAAGCVGESDDAASHPIPASLAKLSSPGLPALAKVNTDCKEQTDARDIDVEFEPGNLMVSNIRVSLNELLQQQETCVANILNMMKYMDKMDPGDNEKTFIKSEVAFQLQEDAITSKTNEGSPEDMESRSNGQCDGIIMETTQDMECQAPPERKSKRQSRRSSATTRTRNSRLFALLESARASIALHQTSQRKTMLGAKQNWIAEHCKTIIENPSFDYMIGFLIFINSVCVGFETESSLGPDGGDKWPQEVDAAFVCIYTVELLMRLIVYGWSSFWDPWIAFDFVLVIVGIISNILLPLLILMTVIPETPNFLDPILVVRSFRLLRLLRAVRMLQQFQIIWRLVYGLLTSMNAMMSTLVLLLLTLYVFACLGVEIISKDAELQAHADTAAVITAHFASLPLTLLTFMQFVSVDSCAAIYAPLIKRRPALIVYFLSIMLVVPIALMNLVTAVLVEGALENTHNEKVALKSEMHDQLVNALPRLERLLTALDYDDDGCVTEVEVKSVPEDILPMDLFENGSVKNIEDLFSMLDVEGRGWMTRDEFLDGLVSIYVMDVPIETVQILKLLYGITDRIQDAMELSKGWPTCGA